MPDVRKNLQVRQPFVEGYEQDDQNGWPTPLTDTSSPLKMAVTSGGSGTQTNKDLTSTSQQDRGEHQLAEGKGKFAGPEADGPVFGGASNPTGLSVAENKASPFETSANIRGQLSKPEGGSGSKNNI